MENVKILIDGVQKDVYGIFYIYDSKYYFIYTEKEVDENDYVVLYMTQVGKETKNTETGPVDTGCMVGIEITNPEEQQKVQTSVSYIVEDKKNNTINPQIQYLPMTMLTNLKIVSKKRFRLLKSIMVDNFKLQFDDVVNNSANQLVDPTINITPVVDQPVIQTLDVLPQPIAQPLQVLSDVSSNVSNNEQLQTQQSIQSNQPVNSVDVNVIVDYRTKYFEEEEKNKELQARIDELTQKLNEIKKVIE